MRASDAPLVTSRIVTLGYTPIGYLGILRFDPAVAAKAAAAVATLQHGGIAALVLDLRNNPGGSLAESVTLAGLFLPANSPVVGIIKRSAIVEGPRTKGHAIYLRASGRATRR